MIVQHTVGTISWQQGNLYPSFMLLSVSNSSLTNPPTAEESVLSQLCFLPTQLYIYIWYAFPSSDDGFSHVKLPLDQKLNFQYQVLVVISIDPSGCCSLANKWL